MKWRPIHILHSVAALAVTCFLSLGGLFLWDSAQTTTTYEALSAHRVSVPVHTVGCFNIVSDVIPRQYSYSNNCYVTFHYQGQHFSAWIDQSFSPTFYVDPLNTKYRMDRTIYINATKNINGDVGLAITFFAGAFLVASVHQYHMFKRRQRRQHLHDPINEGPEVEAGPPSPVGTSESTWVG